MDTLLLVAIVVIAIVAFTYNRLIGARNAVQAAASTIEVQLKRRYDLIPNLIEAVKGQMKFEKGTLEAITAARGGVATAGEGMSSKRIAAENALTSAIGAFRIQVEAYPALRSNENVLGLQEQLTSTENSISFARQAYNSGYLAYKNAVETFPTNLFARLMGFRPDAFAFYDAPEAEEANPKVDLSIG
jgi:LemA protein